MDTLTTSEAIGAAGGQSSDSMSHEPQLSQTSQMSQSGRLRKTAFKFFRGRKSICLLPNFFGGRGKTQGRASSKTGVTKSQTYDGVSKACWEESGRGSGDAASVDFEFLGPNGSGDPQKSRSLPRQRRGLRSFLSSIRRHRKSKTSEPEKTELLEMSSGETVPGAIPSVARHCVDYVSPLGEVATSDDGAVAIRSESGSTPSSTADEHMKDETVVPETWRSKGLIGGKEEDERKSTEGVDSEKEGGRGGMGVLASYRQSLSTVSEKMHLADVSVEFPDDEIPLLSSCSDNMNLVFGDVSSLKSFDSLTGCGDIIADQDDVSVAESSVSGERGGRSGGGKRSSCLVTYQGGGEEMATPEEADSQYLHSLWESDMSTDICYLPSDHTDSPSITPDQPVSSFHITTSSSTLGVTETVHTPTDLLSPQSDRQESVPNSDEGYYDSTTPGADEEARERPQQEGLPRDSYSGDALYELFEPDDRLLSPPLPSKDGCGFLGTPLQGSKGKRDLLFALTSAVLETGAMETEEERLSKIQHALLCCELQNFRSPSKDLCCGDCFYGDADLLEGNGKGTVDEGLHQQGSELLKEALSQTGGPVKHGPLFGPATGPRFSPLQNTVGSEQERCGVPTDGSLPLARGFSQSQEELMVCFSQALVDFTQNARCYRNSTESVDGSESSSPFGQTLSALPAIVTFDVVDMENEGECEQQTELVEEEEELTSPYEPFEEEGCYLQQDAFAECDQRLLDSYEQSLLLSNAWGMASLPRHLSLGRVCAPVPAPLALNRRSRSLDTDSLELQTSELYAPVTTHGPKMAISFHRRKGSLEVTEGCAVSLPQTGRGGRGLELRPAYKNAPSSQQLQKSSRGSPWVDTTPSCTSTCQPSLRPSHLPLQAACHNGRPAYITRVSAEGDIVPGAGGELYPCSYSPEGRQWNSRPVGFTQGIPHLRSDQSEDPREIASKSRRSEMKEAVLHSNT